MVWWIILFLLKAFSLTVVLSLVCFAGVFLLSKMNNDPSMGGAYLALFVLVCVPASAVFSFVSLALWEYLS